MPCHRRPPEIIQCRIDLTNGEYTGALHATQHR